MPGDGSVTHWLRLLQGGDLAAAQHLWNRYFQRLVELAQGKLRHAPRRVADEEDVALSAFDSFCRGAAQGRFPQLRDRDNLWRLLVVITARKAAHLMRDQQRQKRASPTAQPAAEAELCQLIGTEPDPQFALQVAEELERLLAALGDQELRCVALRKMEGFTNEEVATELGCAPRTVERKLQLIRAIWEKESRT